MEQRRFVYILRSDTDPDRHYVGLTSDVARRLHWHDAGPSGVTVRHRPWSLVVSLEFADAQIAWRFERYLKTGSGRAFAKRHFGLAPGELCKRAGYPRAPLSRRRPLPRRLRDDLGER